MIRTILIDDEPSAVNVLSILLKEHCSEDVQVIATSNSPQLGKKLIEQHAPDLVFLDVEMPGLSGIDLVRSFPDPSFRVVFITAYDAYAVEAFRLSAIDYLLKPVEADDIIKVIQKIKKEIHQNIGVSNEQLEKLERLLFQNSGAPEKIGICMADKIVFVNIKDILYCEAQGSYTYVYLQDGKKIVASKPLGEFETQLNERHFFRIHHSTLINLHRIKEFQRLDGGYVMMENNQKLEISKRKRKDFLDAINHLIV